MNRGTVLDAVEQMRAKPEHVRHRIALGAAVGTTAAVTGVWFFALVFSGSLSLAVPQSNATSDTLAAQTSNTDATGNASGAVQQTKSAFSQLLGAVGAAGNDQSAPALTPVDVSTSTPVQANPQDAETGGSQTVIPF